MSNNPIDCGQAKNEREDDSSRLTIVKEDKDNDVVILEDDDKYKETPQWDGKSEGYIRGKSEQKIRPCPSSYTGSGHCGWDAVGSELSRLGYKISGAHLVKVNTLRGVRNPPSEVMDSIADFILSDDSKTIMKALEQHWLRLNKHGSVHFRPTSYAASLRSSGAGRISTDSWCDAFDLIVVSAWLDHKIGPRSVPVYRYHERNGMYVLLSVASTGFPPAVEPLHIDHRSSVIVCTNGLHYKPITVDETRLLSVSGKKRKGQALDPID